MPLPDLEGRIHRELRQLPLVRAPHTLLPRVMQMVQAWRMRPWYQRAWFTWPGYGQAAALAVLVAMVGGVVLLLAPVEGIVSTMSTRLIGGRVESAAGVWQQAGTTIEGARLVWRALVAPVLGYAAAFVILMYVACAAVAFALNRAVFGKVLQS